MRPSRRDLLHALPFSLLPAKPAPSAPALRNLWLRAPSDNLFLPRTRWPWPDPLPTPEAITSQLEALRAASIGGVEVAPPADTLLSPAFVELARHAVSEATRLDMKLSLPMSLSGASIPADQRARALAVSTLDFTGPFQYEGPLPVLRGFSDPGITLAAVGARVTGESLDPSSLTDLTADFAGDAGRWRFEEGAWRLMAFRLVPAGPFVDPLHPSAARRAAGQFARTCLLSFGPMLGRTIDSLAVAPPPDALLWSDSTLSDFRRLQGYDLTPLLPALWFDAGPNTARIRADVRAYLTTLVLAHFYEPILDACRRIFVRARVQPWGRLDPARIAAAVHIPEISDSSTRQAIVTGARAAGRDVISSSGPAGSSLEEMKRSVDAVLCAGATRFYHPALPSLLHYHGLAAYIARASAFLRQGRAAEDFSAKGLLCTHRTLDDGTEVFFLANPSNEPQSTAAVFPVHGRWPEIWDAVPGEIRPAPRWFETQSGIELPLELEPSNSVFVLFHPGRRKAAPARRSAPREIFSVKGPWILARGASGQPGLLTFRASFPARRRNAELDLGRIPGSVEASLNGHPLGLRWLRPFRFQIPARLLRNGENSLELRLAAAPPRAVQAWNEIPTTAADEFGPVTLKFF